MSEHNKLLPLPKPAPVDPVTSDVVASGQNIPPIERIRLFSPDQWEEFVYEWADSFCDTYVNVEHHGGSCDMGRDGGVDTK
jgi:hypothetical protein